MTTTTDPSPAAATLRRAQDILILTKAAGVLIDEFELTTAQTVWLTSKVLAVTLDRLGQELIGPERDLTDEEVQIGSDFIDALPDGPICSIEQFVNVFKDRLALIR